MKITCLLIDDEPLALDVLASYIAKIDSMEVIARCNNALQAFDAIQRQKVDLLFLDIQMPKLNGLEFLKTLKNPPKVIFTTAYREFAIEAFEVDALDYLVKPISFSRFLKAASKAMQSLQVPAPSVPEIVIHQQDEHIQLKSMEHIFVKADKKMIKVCLCDILFIESLKDYVLIHTPGKRIITKQKISFLEEKLPEDQFLRIHRSFLINVDKIEAFSSTSIEVYQRELPIGRSYKSVVNKFLEL